MPKASMLIAKVLKDLGVTHVFGIPGKAVAPLVLAINDSGMEFVLARHECGAGFAASGYALQRQGLGVAIGTCGPGGTNLLTSAAQAKAYQLPVLFISGQPMMNDSGKPLSQDSTMFGVDLVAMFRSTCKFSARIERGDLVHLYVEAALQAALTGTPGPVHLSIPMDVLLADIPEFTLRIKSETSTPDQISECISLLQEARKPLMIVGEGVNLNRANMELITIAEHYRTPVVMVPAGKSALPDHHPLNKGIYGLGGHPTAAQAVNEEHDLLIVIGTRLEDMAFPNYTPSRLPKQVVYIDNDHGFHGKVIRAEEELKLLGNVKHILKRVAELSGLAVDHERDFSINKTVEVSQSPVMKSAEVCSMLSNLVPYEYTVFSDVGNHGYFATRHLGLQRPGSFVFDDYFACMGHAIGYALGAKLAAPDQGIICLSGDGCFFMHGTEISTAVSVKTDIIYIVFNNGCLDMANKGMRGAGGRQDGTVFHAPFDVKAFADSLGAVGHSCSNVTQLANSVRRALDGGVHVIEVMVDPEEESPTAARKLSV